MNAEQKKSSGDKLSIGVIIDWTETPYHTNLVSGILDGAEAFDLNCYIFAGGSIHSPVEREAPRNIIYNFINNESLSGLLVAAGSLTHYAHPSELEKFLSRYAPLPIVTISLPIGNYPCVYCDSRIGFRELLHHLIRDHGYRRIAYIHGPRDNSEAKERFETYREVLDESGIPYEPDLVASGDFVLESGKRAAMTLLAERKLELDAIVASNDEMALGAIEVIRNRRLSVPRDVAVTGFDDIDIAQCLTPTLSTVHQPLAELGKKAVETLSLLLKGESIPQATVLQSRFITRESCGCSRVQGAVKTREYGLAEARKKRTGEKSGPSIFLTKLMSEHKDCACSLGAELVREVSTAYYKSVLSGDGVSYFNALELAAGNGVLLADRAEPFTSLLMSMPRAIEPLLESQTDICFAYSLALDSASFVSRLLHREYRYRGAVEGRDIQDLIRYNAELGAAKGIDDFVEILVCQLANVGIASCYLSLYEDETPDSANSLSRIIFAYCAGKRVPLERGGRLFPSRKLVPDGIIPEKTRFSFFVEPLFFGNTQLGFVLIESFHIKGEIEDLVRRLFTNIALKGAMYVHQIGIQTLNFEAQVTSRTEALMRANELLSRLYNERKVAENTVRKLNEELEKRVISRTLELEETNKELKKALLRLKSTQEQLVQSEKMAALGGLVAGISHEINTPIGISVTAASYMEKRTQELFGIYGENKLRRTELEEYLGLMLQASAMVLSNLKKSYEMIHDFKNIAVDQTVEEKKTFNAREYLEKVLAGLDHEIRTRGHMLALECDEGLVMTSYPGALGRIISHLVSNSLAHGFDEGNRGRLDLRFSRQGKKIMLLYSDNGRGIAKRNTKKIFTPFFTTKRSEGRLGLGLHIVFNLVTRTLGGRISFTSEPGAGMTFKITIPEEE